MIAALLIGLFLGTFTGNALPHFLRGITRRRYPSLFGGHPVVNFIAGWVGLAVSAGIAAWAWPLLTAHGAVAGAGALAGLLGIGLFHAGPGAFGRLD